LGPRLQTRWLLLALRAWGPRLLQTRWLLLALRAWGLSPLQTRWLLPALLAWRHSQQLLLATRLLHSRCQQLQLHLRAWGR
jgi:hypothetical protein